jgi:23S rRNA pseudouridine2605 synthase
MAEQTSDQEDRAGIRLQLFLARAGIGSRRTCETYITSGRVAVNGKTVTTLVTKVLPEDTVSMDGSPVRPEIRLVYIALNKPQRYLCSNSDPQGRPLVVSFLKPSVSERVFHVGRLDYLSSGLIFFTNDGEFARKMTHPSSRIEKEYLVETKDAIKESSLEEFQRGVWIEGEKYRIASYVLLSPQKVRLVLTEGKNREIRNFFIDKRIKVKRIHRIRIGGVRLGKLEPGQWRYLTKKEVADLLLLSERTDHGHRD